MDCIKIAIIFSAVVVGIMLLILIATAIVTGIVCSKVGKDEKLTKRTKLTIDRLEEIFKQIKDGTYNDDISSLDFSQFGPESTSVLKENLEACDSGWKDKYPKLAHAIRYKLTS